MSTEQLSKAKLLHLLTDPPAKILGAREKYLNRNRKLLRQYEEIYMKRRIETRLKLLHNRRAVKDAARFPVGSMVLVHRPAKSKVQMEWSEARRVEEAPSEATRLVRKANGEVTLEYVGNLKEVGDSPTESPGVVPAGADCSVLTELIE